MKELLIQTFLLKEITTHITHYHESLKLSFSLSKTMLRKNLTDKKKGAQKLLNNSCMQLGLFKFVMAIKAQYNKEDKVKK